MTHSWRSSCSVLRPLHSQVTLGGKQYFPGLYDTGGQEAYDCLGPLTNKRCLPYMLLCGKSSFNCERGEGTRT